MAGLSWEEAQTILQLPPEANRDEIRGAYRRLVKMTHPDLNPAQDGERFCLVKDAYLVMLRNAPRSKYQSEEEMLEYDQDDELVPVVYRKSHWSRLCQWWYQQTHRRGARVSRYSQSRQL